MSSKINKMNDKKDAEFEKRTRDEQIEYIMTEIQKINSKIENGKLDFPNLTEMIQKLIKGNVTIFQGFCVCF